MHRILFVCYGNMCRSPMAEFVMKHLVALRGLRDRFKICSAGVGYNIAGDPMALGDTEAMDRHGIPYDASRLSRQFVPEDYSEYDIILAMDKDNYTALMDITGNDPDRKVFKFLSAAGEDRDVDDPYYTGDFETAYEDIRKGCEALLALWPEA